MMPRERPFEILQAVGNEFNLKEAPICQYCISIYVDKIRYMQETNLLGKSVAVNLGVEVNETEEVTHRSEHALADVISG